MRELKSKIPSLAKERGWTLNQFRGECIKHGFSDPTARKFWDGDTNTTTANLRDLAFIFGVDSIADVMDIE